MKLLSISALIETKKMHFYFRYDNLLNYVFLFYVDNMFYIYGVRPPVLTPITPAISTIS